MSIVSCCVNSLAEQGLSTKGTKAQLLQRLKDPGAANALEPARCMGPKAAKARPPQIRAASAAHSGGEGPSGRRNPHCAAASGGGLKSGRVNGVMQSGVRINMRVSFLSIVDRNCRHMLCTRAMQHLGLGCNLEYNDAKFSVRHERL